MFEASRVSFNVLLGGLLLAGGLTACAGGAVDTPYNGTYDPAMPILPFARLPDPAVGRQRDHDRRSARHSCWPPPAPPRG